MRASVIVLCFNALEEATRPCVESLYRNTPVSEFELVVVDNASADGTPAYLRELERTHDNVRVQFNDTNKGYAGGNNDGLRLARGEYLVLLNNDTLVPAGWLDRLLHLLETNANVGMVGPITNSAGNEQRVELSGLNETNFEEIAARYTARHRGVWFPTEKLGFFCVAMRRDLPERVGYLDERFGIGMFEDDDFCLRVQREAGYTLAVAEDCFVYHKGSVSFEKLGLENYRGLFDHNRLQFQSKHGMAWTFSALAFQYWEKINRDLSAYKEAGTVHPSIERIMVRFENLRHLLIQVHRAESGDRNSAGGTGDDPIRHHRWRARWHYVRSQFILGSRAQKIRFVKQAVARIVEILRRRGSAPYDPVVSALAAIRTVTRFERAVIFPATIDFHYISQRPQQLARAFAKLGWLVIYGTLNHTHDKVDVWQNVATNLYLVNEKWFPLLHYVLKPEETLYFCTWPNNIKHLQYLPCSHVLYDWMDDLALLDLSRETAERDHGELIERADTVTVTSSKLQDAVPHRFRQKTILLSNAVSEDFIEAVQSPSAPPAQLRKLNGRKILGYYGAIAEWLDFDLLAATASRFSDACAIVLIGPVIGPSDRLDSLLSRHPNIHHFKERPQKELIPFLQHFDVCLIPFLKNDITDAVSPVKLFEYLAAGKPVVTTDLAECRKYAAVACAPTTAEFIASIEGFLGTSSELRREAGLVIAKENTWEGRVRTLEKRLALSTGHKADPEPLPVQDVTCEANSHGRQA